ncbi:MAG: TIGR01777 family oxidoreductase [Opitutales bacterium]
MRVAITGGTGLVGRALVKTLRARGDDVAIISRSEAADVITWDIGRGLIDETALEGFDAIVHLAGENIAAGRWNAARKQRIYDSRIESTRLLVKTVEKLAQRPSIFVSASAVGYYDPGPHTEILTEATPAGSGFLPEVCRDWEAASEPLEALGVRRCLGRIGVVLSREDGALKKMLLPFKLGLGGPLGHGHQRFPWVHLDDLVAAFCFCLDVEAAQGPYNFTGPEPVSMKQFAQAMGRALKRPAVLPVPQFMLKLVLGEMGEELLMADFPVVPRRLQDAGFEFRFKTIDAALADLLNNKQ